MSLSWQAYLLLNLSGLLALSFWLGSLATTTRRLKDDVEAISKAREADRRSYEEKIQRLRSAYHRMSGFLQSESPKWKPYDLDAE